MLKVQLNTTRTSGKVSVKTLCKYIVVGLKLQLTLTSPKKISVLKSYPDMMIMYCRKSSDFLTQKKL